MGENGAGKSTLVKCLFGSYRKDEGEIFLSGRTVDFKNPKDALENGVTMVHQELNLCLDMTVADNLFLGRFPKRFGVIDEHKMYESAHNLFSQLKININPARIVRTMSVAEKQMIEIAKAVSKDAKILVFDEPTAALSDSETKRLFEIITQLKNEGVSMVYISHRMNEILSICDSITILKDGEYVTTQDIKDMTLDKIVSYMMGGTSGKGHKFEWVERKHDENAGDVLKVEHLKVNEKINDISFTLKHGEIVGFAGLMGSGRTEILESLFGLRKKEKILLMLYRTDLPLSRRIEEKKDLY